ncbi:MAG TPA: right-handed parallel beta-helix repeat-containing protein [Isosphaeraceae bacterium]|jgi:hypothetical protein|nr:right-handed parallel beta-helix repeat-containing protein [Isosphaeraceae bacterium]
MRTSPELPPRPTHRPRADRPRPARRPRRAWLVEALEGRALLSVVSNANDSGPGSLRDAIDTAAPGDVITFDPTLNGSTIGLSYGLEIKTDLTIQGLGASDLTVDGGGNGTVFTVDAGVTATISGLTITNGEVFVDDPRGDSGGGGGILNMGSLTLDDSTVSNNFVHVGGGFLQDFPVYGGGIWNDGGTLTVVGSTITGNGLESISVYDTSNYPGDDAPPAEGGGIASTGGDVTIEGSTISGNAAAGIDVFVQQQPPGLPGAWGGDAAGGGIAVTAGRLLVLDSTVSGNSATGANGDFGGPGGYQFFTPDGKDGGNGGMAVGGGIEVAGGTATIESSTITGNSATGGSGGSGGDADTSGDLSPYPYSSYDGGAGGRGGSAAGGGINVEAGAGPVAVTASSVTANTAQGGLGAPGGAGGVGETYDQDGNTIPIIGNEGADGSGGSTAGGGVAGGVGLTVLNTTITGNQTFGGNVAPDDNSGGGGNAVGANLSGDAGTIVANGTIGPNVGTAAGTGGSSGTNGTVADSAPFVRLSIQFSGYRYNRVNHHFVQVVTVAQVGGPAFGGTIDLALDGLPSGVTLANAAGTTAATLPSGSPYVIINLENGPATILLDFADPSLAQVKYTPRLIAGAP